MRLRANLATAGLHHRGGIQRLVSCVACSTVGLLQAAPLVSRSPRGIWTRQHHVIRSRDALIFGWRRPGRRSGGCRGSGQVCCGMPPGSSVLNLSTCCVSFRTQRGDVVWQWRRRGWSRLQRGGADSRRRGCHYSAALPPSYSRCFNRHREGVSAK